MGVVVWVGVSVGVDVFVTVCVGVGVGVLVDTGVLVPVVVGLGVGVCVFVGVGVGIQGLFIIQSLQLSKINSSSQINVGIVPFLIIPVIVKQPPFRIIVLPIIKVDGKITTPDKVPQQDKTL